ncbi:MAG: serine/threonine protein kinase, partial [Planctomycetaceae bacterium]|nr:serine/threonine protein kinase [Planctomycetaceae bacterium]
LAVAVHAGHTCGVIHRDLKPGNVIVAGCSDGKPDVRIIDFGLSLPTDVAMRDTRGSFVAGTPAYMAPEQAEGFIDAICPATDVFALGAILYELLTGTPPFFAETLPAVLDRLENESAVPPGKFRRDVDRDLETVCLKCLAHSPADRYQTAQELANDLERLSIGEPVTAEPPSFRQRIKRWASRSRTRTALAHTSAAINVLLLIWSIVAVPVSLLALRDDPTADRSILPMLIPLAVVIVPLHTTLIWLSLRLRARRPRRSAFAGLLLSSLTLAYAATVLTGLTAPAPIYEQNPFARAIAFTLVGLGAAIMTAIFAVCAVTSSDSNRR